jgi:hypothetical protein
MPKDIELPVTKDGNDFADFDKATLDAVNSQIDDAAAVLRVGLISPSEAKEYIQLYKDLKAQCLRRGQDVIKCPITNSKYRACLVVLGESK